MSLTQSHIVSTLPILSWISAAEPDPGSYFSTLPQPRPRKADTFPHGSAFRQSSLVHRCDTCLKLFKQSDIMKYHRQTHDPNLEYPYPYNQNGCASNVLRKQNCSNYLR